MYTLMHRAGWGFGSDDRSSRLRGNPNGRHLPGANTYCPGLLVGMTGFSYDHTLSATRHFGSRSISHPPTNRRIHHYPTVTHGPKFHKPPSGCQCCLDHSTFILRPPAHALPNERNHQTGLIAIRSHRRTNHKSVCIYGGVGETLQLAPC